MTPYEKPITNKKIVFNDNDEEDNGENNEIAKQIISEANDLSDFVDEDVLKIIKKKKRKRDASVSEESSVKKSRKTKKEKNVDKSLDESDVKDLSCSISFDMSNSPPVKVEEGTRDAFEEFLANNEFFH